MDELLIFVSSLMFVLIVTCRRQNYMEVRCLDPAKRVWRSSSTVAVTASSRYSTLRPDDCPPPRVEQSGLFDFLYGLVWIGEDGGRHPRAGSFPPLLFIHSVHDHGFHGDRTMKRLGVTTDHDAACSDSTRVCCSSLSQIWRSTSFSFLHTFGFDINPI
jgi:hypothetical protein